MLSYFPFSWWICAETCPSNGSMTLHKESFINSFFWRHISRTVACLVIVSNYFLQVWKNCNMVHQFEISHSIRKMMNKHSLCLQWQTQMYFNAGILKGVDIISFKNNWIDYHHLQVKIIFHKINKYIIFLNWKRNCNLYVISFQNAEYKTTYFVFSNNAILLNKKCVSSNMLKIKLPSSSVWIFFFFKWGQSANNTKADRSLNQTKATDEQIQTRACSPHFCSLPIPKQCLFQAAIPALSPLLPSSIPGTPRKWAVRSVSPLKQAPNPSLLFLYPSPKANIPPKVSNCFPCCKTLVARRKPTAWQQIFKTTTLALLLTELYIASMK